MPSTDFDAEKEAFKDYYSRNVDVLRSGTESLRTLLGLLLTDHDDFSTPQVSGRVKDRDECIAKFDRKYRAKCEEFGTPYEIREYITDLVGLRIVCLYDSDIHLVRAVLADKFRNPGRDRQGASARNARERVRLQGAAP